MRPLRKSALSRLAIFLPVAVIALASTVVGATSEFLTNPSFTSSGGGWAGASGGPGCNFGLPSMGEWEQGDLTFSYVRSTVSQTVIVPYPSTLSLKYVVQDRYEEWIEGAYRVDLVDDDQNVSSGEQVAPDQETEFELTITTTSINEDVTVSISGDDGPTIAWAGCYGPSFKSASLVATYTDPINVPHVYGQANEGWDLTLTAPEGFRFTEPLFASYGNPSGYSLGWCNATNSVQKVTEVFAGQTSATIAASNSIFGDPCGGTYKKLIVAMKYEPIPGYTTTTSTSTTTTVPSCPSYEPFEVTGAINGAVWGSNPYTDDSNFGVAAVHAGLIEEGGTATIEPFDVQYYTSYPGSTSNNVTTSDWNAGWCGYKIRLFEVPTTSTSTTTSITVQETTTTSTTVQETTTTTEAVPQTTTTQEPTTTTVESTTIPETTIVEQPTTTVPKTTTTEKVIVNATTAIAPTTTSSLPEPTPNQEDEGEEEISVTTTTQPVTEKAVEAIEAAISGQGEISPEQATEIATNPEVIAQLTGDQAAEVFESIEVEALSDNEAAAVVAAVQLASQEVRKAFETKINVFGGKFDTYVPVGSKVTVGERRTLVAAGAVLFVTPVVMTSSTNTTTSQNSPSKRSD